MATSMTTSIPLWLTGQTYDSNAGNDLRNSSVTANWLDTGAISGSTIGVRSGVTGGAGLGVTAASGMNVTVGAGSFVVAVTGSPASGGYQSTLPSSATLTVQTADPSNPRIDIVCAGVTDTGGSTSSGWVQIITGTAAASPAAPAAPANSIILARISVAKGATSITAAAISDVRPYTVTAGGVLPAARGSVGGYNGQLAYDAASGAFYHNARTGSQQARVLPFAPVTVTRTTSFAYPASPTTVLSANVTVDGATDLQITYHVLSVAPSDGNENQIFHQIAVAGTVIDVTAANVPADQEGALGSGFTSVTYTTSALGRPAAGTRTVTFQAWASNPGGGFPLMRGISTAPNAPTAWLRVEPVIL